MSKEEEEDTNKANYYKCLANAKVLLKQKRFSLLHLSQIYQIIRFEDYDEDRLLVILRRMRLLKFARRWCIYFQSICIWKTAMHLLHP